MTREILEKLGNAIIDGDSEAAEQAARDAVAAGIPPLVAIEEGANKGMQVVGDRFGRFEVFLPELMLAGEAMNAAIRVLLRALPADQAAAAQRGKVVIATVSGDIHDIGKNIVSALLTANGFEVFDLGVNVDVKQIMRRTREERANIIALSTLLTTSLPFQEDVVRYLDDSGMRDQFFVIVGGGPVGPDWAGRIGADGYGRTAAHAIELCKRLMAAGKPPLAEPIVLDFQG
jgi:corrinoid protein of di/trimethylamine methyltransferase